MKIGRPVLKYFGSKWRIAPRIIELLGKHDSYVEPFGGSAAVLLQKAESPLEVFNDLNQEIVNFFRVLRDKPIELLGLIELTPFSRGEYKVAASSLGLDGSDLERARSFFTLSWQGFSGSATQKRNGWRYQQRIYNNREAKVHIDWHHLERVEAAAVRIRRVQIECDDALKVIQRFDSPSTAFYIDPPYPSSTRSKQWGKCAYLYEMGNQDHILLLNLVKRLQGHVVLSCYESSLYKEYLPGWKKVEIATRNQRTTAATEILWIKP